MRMIQEHAIEVLYSKEYDKWFQSIYLYRFFPSLLQTERTQVCFFEIKEGDAKLMIDILKLVINESESPSIVWYHGREYKKKQQYFDKLLGKTKKTLLKNKTHG